MPTYNYASYLPEAIASVLAQDFRDFELLIIDDCSADNTAEVVKPFCDQDARVRFSVNPTNLGIANNWNLCLEQARGQYIKYLFGDDKLAGPQALGKMRLLLQNNPSATLAASARLILDEKSGVTDVWRTLPEGCHEGREIIAECLCENANLVGEPSAVMFRKKDAPRSFDPKFRQILDVEMWFYLLERGGLVYTREPLCAFRQHFHQFSAVNDREGLAWKEHLAFFSNYATRPDFSRKVRFSALFALRRARRKNPGPFYEDILETENLLNQELGKRWYWLYWLRYKLSRPFYNLKRSMTKISNRV
jgi:glycosyltransferase involved in cell wall biosynthesis